MSYVRSDGYTLKDPDDDAAFQVVIGDLQRLALNLYKGTPNAAYVTPSDDLSGFLVASNNLSDVTDAATARTNLGITSGSFAAANVLLYGPSGTIGAGNVIAWTGESWNNGGTLTSDLVNGTITPSVDGYYLATVTFQFGTGTLGFGVATFTPNFYLAGSPVGVGNTLWVFYAAGGTAGAHYNLVIHATAGQAIAARFGTNGGATGPSHGTGEFSVVRVG